MQNEGRIIPIQIHLTEEEKEILDIKYKMSKSKSKVTEETPPAFPR